MCATSRILLINAALLAMAFGAQAQVPGMPPKAECDAFMDVVSRTTDLRREIQTDASTKAKAEGCLALGPVQLPKQIGYVCFIKDPDGNTVEFSYDQGVYEKAREVWGKAMATG